MAAIIVIKFYHYKGWVNDYPVCVYSSSAEEKLIVNKWFHVKITGIFRDFSYIYEENEWQYNVVVKCTSCGRECLVSHSVSLLVCASVSSFTKWG